MILLKLFCQNPPSLDKYLAQWPSPTPISQNNFILFPFSFLTWQVKNPNYLCRARLDLVERLHENNNLWPKWSFQLDLVEFDEDFLRFATFKSEKYSFKLQIDNIVFLCLLNLLNMKSQNNYNLSKHQIHLFKKIWDDWYD